MALGKAVKRNIALSGKWLWRYPLEQHSLWASVIRSKFGHNSNCWDATHFISSSHRSIWKHISQSLLLFRPHTKLSLGNGNKIWFRLDPWADPQPLSIRFQHLFNLPHREKVQSHPFSPRLPFGISNFVVTREILKFLSLSTLIDQFHRSPSTLDSRVWSLSPSGVFSISSFFLALKFPLLPPFLFL